MIDHDRKLIFVHIVRTGGTSIEAALVGGDWFRIEPETKHLSVSQARRLYGEETWSAYTTFSVVRNPWDRLVSMWVAKWWLRTAGYPDDTPFREFLLMVTPHRNEKYNSLHCHEILDDELDFTLRFENLPADFSNMLTSTGREDVELPHIQKGDRPHYREVYDEETREMVAQRWARDIADYGYTF